MYPSVNWLSNAFGQLLSIRRTRGTSKLLSLQPELLLLIADMLPISSTICLALCCRRLCQLFGPETWKALRDAGRDEKLAFLQAIAKDRSQYFVCHSCICLHHNRTIPWPRTRTQPCRPSPCCVSAGTGYHPFPFGYEVLFCHVQLAMEQYYHGPEIGFPLEAFHYVQANDPYIGGGTTLLSVDAQIVSGEFLMRSQSWTLLPKKQRRELAEIGSRHGLCGHLMLHVLNDSTMLKILGPFFDQLEDQEGGEMQTQTMQCLYCLMDFTLGAVDLGHRGFAVVCTKWVNLGAGISPTDAKWQGHFSAERREVVLGHLPHVLGSIRNGFESQAAVSVDELTSGNKMKLCSNRDHNKMVTRGPDGLVWTWAGPGVWYLAHSWLPDEYYRRR